MSRDMKYCCAKLSLLSGTDFDRLLTCSKVPIKIKTIVNTLDDIGKDAIVSVCCLSLFWSCLDQFTVHDKMFLF